MLKGLHHNWAIYNYVFTSQKTDNSCCLVLFPDFSYNKRPDRPYPALRYSEKGYQVSEGEQPSASDLQKF